MFIVFNFVALFFLFLCCHSFYCLFLHKELRNPLALRHPFFLYQHS